MATGIRVRPETLGVGVLLTAAGGYLDAYTFVAHRVFANAQTGNVVLIAVAASQQRWSAAFTRVPPVIAFMVGIALVEILAHEPVRRSLRRPVRVALAAEIALLGVVAALPGSTPVLVTTVTVSFVAAIQFGTFRNLVDDSYTSLATTGNIRALVTAIVHWFTRHDPRARTRAARFAAIVTAFAAGALAGAMLTRTMHGAAAAVPATVLVLVLIWLVYETYRIEGAGRIEPAGPADSDDDQQTD